MPEPNAIVGPESHGAVPAKMGIWDRLPIVLAALNPVLLLVVGWVLNAGIERNKLELEQNKARIEDLKTIAETQTLDLHQRVDKVKVIGDFINDLSGPDDRRRSLAIEAIFIALPDEAARLVKVVEKFAARGTVGDKDIAAAKDALADTRSRLVSDMFSLSRAVRVDALTTLQRGWVDDGPVVDLLIARATQDVAGRAAMGWPAQPTSQPQASVYNTVDFLRHIREPDDPALKGKINRFLQIAAPNSDDTRRAVAEIGARFN